MVLTVNPSARSSPSNTRACQAERSCSGTKTTAHTWALVKFDLLGLGMLGAINQVFVEIEKRFGETCSNSEQFRAKSPRCTTRCVVPTSSACFRSNRAHKWGCSPDSPSLLLRPRRRNRDGSPRPDSRRQRSPVHSPSNGTVEPVTYDHPNLEPVLARTHGNSRVPGTTHANRDGRRRVQRRRRRCHSSFHWVKARYRTARDESKKSSTTAWRPTASRATAADRSTVTLEAFANFGFAESHSIAFSLLVYVSSWLKVHYPAAFLVGLMRSQPMGFYSSATLAADAERHGVEVRVPCIARSGSGVGARGHSQRVLTA
jgi:error-prone DNA polymerase